jgi:hypothetical protein
MNRSGALVNACREGNDTCIWGSLGFLMAHAVSICSQRAPTTWYSKRDRADRASPTGWKGDRGDARRSAGCYPFSTLRVTPSQSHAVSEPLAHGLFHSSSQARTSSHPQPSLRRTSCSSLARRAFFLDQTPASTMVLSPSLTGAPPLPLQPPDRIAAHTLGGSLRTNKGTYSTCSPARHGRGTQRSLSRAYQGSRMIPRRRLAPAAMYGQSAGTSTGNG